MTPAERGKIIKEARISKKMSQSEVAGNFITRNMLSQIESGKATPSVKTLEYLASVLDIPVAAYTQGDEEEPAVISGAEKLVRVKMLFLEGSYSEAQELIGENDEHGAFYDELTAISAKCCYHLAESLSEENTVKAVEYAKQAAELSERGIYADRQLKTDSLKLLNILAEKLSRYYAGLISEV